MPQPPRSAEAILADLQALDRENDRLEFRLTMVRQSLKAAEAHATDPEGRSEDLCRLLDRASGCLRKAG